MARGPVSRRSRGWCFRLDAGDQAATGRRRQISRQGFATKREAVAALHTSLAEANATTSASVELGGAAVRDYLAQWLEGQRPYLRASTLRSYRIAVDRIINRLGDTTLNSLTSSQVQRLQTDLLANGKRDSRPLAAKTVANTHQVLHKTLADAVRLELLDHNVVAAVDPPRVPRPQLSVWTVDQLRDFLREFASLVGGVRVVGHDWYASQRGTRAAMVRHRLRRSFGVDRSYPDGGRWSPHRHGTKDDGEPSIGISRLERAARAAEKSRVWHAPSRERVIAR